MVIPRPQTHGNPPIVLPPRLLRRAEPPPLDTGDRLSRAEFERRYRAHPEIKKAELIEGVVYMPSPIRHDKHSQPHSWMVIWLGNYMVTTPGADVGDNATIRLDFENEVQPDTFLRLKSEYGGRSHLTKDGYLQGPPELIVEVAASSAAYDLHVKRRVYARNGVQEYLVVQMYDRRIDWFVLREGVYETLAPNEDGVIRSEIFPGLWLDVNAFWAGDPAAMLATLQHGLNTPEHADFVARLQEERA